MFGGTHAQALLDVVIEVADGDTGHGGAPVAEKHLIVIIECIAINDYNQAQSENSSPSGDLLSVQRVTGSVAPNRDTASASSAMPAAGWRGLTRSPVRVRRTAHGCHALPKQGVGPGWHVGCVALP